jgi:class 3 adenylate cyclase
VLGVGLDPRRDAGHSLRSGVDRKERVAGRVAAAQSLTWTPRPETISGQILTSARVATAVENTASLEEIGDLSLKGLSQAVSVYNVVAVGAETSAS